MKTKILNFGLLLLFGVFLSTATMAQQMAHKANATRAFGIPPAGSNDNSSSDISDTDIPATTVSYNYRDVNMDRYITLTVTNGEDISIDLAADAEDTPVQIVSGDKVSNITVGTSWTDFTDYDAGATTMTIYGNIREFDCSGNGDKITGLDASHNTALTKLYCKDNKIENLDVSQNTVLTKLYCKDNEIESLDVSQNTVLTELYCYNNQLTSLKLSGAAALTKLSCRNNQLTSLDVSQNTDLNYLNCYGNPFTTQAVDNIFCSLPEREASAKGKLYILNNTSDANKDEVLASNKQNAIDKNWNVW